MLFRFFPSPTKPHSLDRVVSLLFVSSFFLCLQPPCFLFRHRSLGSVSTHQLEQHSYKHPVFVRPV